MKGRNPRLLELRNQKLIKQYYYRYDILRNRYDDVLEALMLKEIFLTKETIGFLLRNNDHLLQEIRRYFAGKKPSENKIMAYDFVGEDVPAMIQTELFKN